MRFSLFKNAITIFGAALTTTGALVFLTFFLLELAGMHPNPYLGMLFFLICPGLFVAGLLVMPIGVWLAHRRDAAGLKAWRPSWPRIDLNDGTQRRAAAIFVASTVANVLLVSVAAYSGIEYMDSPQFCGQLCHEVMEPEWAGYQQGPHSRVACVQCHIGPGAGWFVKSKMSGLRQVYAVTFNTHSRPIPSPVHDLRPARDTCEQCHWPEKFHGDKVRTIRTYADDEANTESVTALRLHIGGINRLDKSATGIHWHVSQMNRIEYIATDDKRQVIPYVKLDDGKGNVTEFFADGVTDAGSLKGERRVLDCVDCHNRPSHTFCVLGRACGRRGDDHRRVRRQDALHPARGGQSAEGRVCRQGGGVQRHRGRAESVLQGPPRRGGGSGGAGGGDRPARLRAQRVPLDERDLGIVRQQRRPQRAWAKSVPRVFPVPRREPQVEAGESNLAGLQPLPHHRVVRFAAGRQSD